MPASLFKSRPKSDLRLQWKTLKAKHAKTVDPKKVEVGLGKALDTHQKQVDAIVQLEAKALTAEAFAPVLASAAAVKKLAVGLEPKVKGNTDYVKFLTVLKQDAGWWETAAKEIKSTPGYVDNWDAEELTTVLNGALKLETCLIQLDTMLKPASKQTKTYTPPAEVGKWLTVAQELKPVLAKLSVLKKNRTGNFKLIVTLLREHKGKFSDARTFAMHLASVQRDNANLQPVTNWDEVVSAAQDAMDAAFSTNQAIGRLRDR
jgi:hypothetical protein